MKKLKIILATTYAVNPYKGSEDGIGWNFVKQIARFHQVIAITRQNNRGDIERYMMENPDLLYENIKFVYFDLPNWMRFWKKKGRGALLYYWMWQRSLPGFIRRSKLEFDIVHNVNFNNDWTPSYLWKLGKPFVWGPIGHHPLIPAQYLEPYNKKYFVKDRLTWMVKKLFWNFSQDLRKTVEMADHIWCMNESVLQAISVPDGKYSVVPSVATEDFGFDPKGKNGKFTLISAGRLVPLKGYDLSIMAFASFISELDSVSRKKCELLIVGRGPESGFYMNMVEELGIDGQVRFIDWIERRSLLNLFRDASISIFPSHEGAGMVVPEALSFGLPVICLDNCGPGKFITPACGKVIGEQNYNATIKQLAAAISHFFYNRKSLTDASINARERFEDLFHWDRRGEHLFNIYQNL